MQTIQETIQQLHGSLRDYIEATYHISAPSLIKQRKELLDRVVEIVQRACGGTPEVIGFPS